MTDSQNFIIEYKFHPLLLQRVQELLQCNDLHMKILQDALKDYF